MSAYPFNPSVLTWNPPRPHPSGSFRPRGPFLHHGPRINPTMWQSRRTVAGRIIVGFNVGATPTWTMADLIALVRRVRVAQIGDPSSTFVAQTGVYQHRDGTSVVQEDGGQVFVINTAGLSDKKFRKQMIALAETIAREFTQESVILEIQVNGISKFTMGVEA